MEKNRKNKGGERLKFTKQLIIGLSVVMVLIVAGTAYASFVLQSNSAHVTLAYQVAVETTVVGSSVNLKATVTNEGNPVSGIEVTFYQTDSTGNIYTIPDPNVPGSHIALWSSSAMTNPNGIATAVYSASGNIDTYFTAYATIP